jgi:hypothetical protein
MYKALRVEIAPRSPRINTLSHIAKKVGNKTAKALAMKGYLKPPLERPRTIALISLTLR